MLKLGNIHENLVDRKKGKDQKQNK